MRRLLTFMALKTHILGVGGYKEHIEYSAKTQKTQHLSEKFKIQKKNFLEENGNFLLKE